LAKVDAVLGQVDRTKSFQYSISPGQRKPYLKIDQTSSASALPSFKRDEKGMRLLLSVMTDELLCVDAAMYDLKILEDGKGQRYSLKEASNMDDRGSMAFRSGTSDVN
jgi:hypothetical protein